MAHRARPCSDLLWGKQKQSLTHNGIRNSPGVDCPPLGNQVLICLLLWHGVGSPHRLTPAKIAFKGIAGARASTMLWCKLKTGNPILLSGASSCQGRGASSDSAQYLFAAKSSDAVQSLRDVVSKCHKKLCDFFHENFSPATFKYWIALAYGWP